MKSGYQKNSGALKMIKQVTFCDCRSEIVLKMRGVDKERIAKEILWNLKDR